MIPEYADALRLYKRTRLRRKLEGYDLDRDGVPINVTEAQFMQLDSTAVLTMLARDLNTQDFIELLQDIRQSSIDDISHIEELDELIAEARRTWGGRPRLYALEVSRQEN